MDWRLILQQSAKPGWVRRCAILAIVCLMAAVCVLLALRSPQGEASLAFEIFLVSVIGFSMVAMLSYDATLCWRFVDFPWICTSFAAIVVALLNIAETGRREQIAFARSEISRSFSELIYATQSVVTNDCQELPTRNNMWRRSPEPYEGACDRMKHFLPQMTYQYDEFARSQDVSSLKGWAMNMFIPDITPVGSWAGHYDSARRFIRVSDRHEPVIAEAASASQSTARADRLRRFILTTDLRYWYFFMAFFVGLRLSKTTAEVLQARAARR